MKAVNCKNIIFYVILFPFLFPRGFSEYLPVYKQIMTIWLCIVILGIVFYLFSQLATRKLEVKSGFFCVLLYFGVMFTQTLLIQGKIDEGLQKIFATPALFIFFMISFQKKGKEVIVAMANILLISNILNCTLFSPVLLQKMMGEHYITNIMFIGHVQMSSQIGILGIALGYFIFRFGYKRRGRILILFSLVTMLISDAIASYLVLGLIIVAYMFFVFGKYFFAKLSPKLLFISGTVLQAIMIPIVIYNGIDFNARIYVWIDALRQLAGHYVTGFGVYGVLIHTFWMEWTGDLGMNYAHNEVLQLLLDGGIILFAFYFIMCLSMIKKYSSKVELKTQYWFNCFLMLYMLIGVSESVTEYNYFYIFIVLILFLPEISNCFVIE